MKNIELHNCDNLELMQNLADESIDVILTDPPYLYLKNQKLEREFDEQLFFSECKRVLTKNGFIVLFGRGTSFYRWNTILADLGFEFKEEIVWDKAHNTSPLLPISRIHETVSIHTNGTNKINKVKVPYLEMKSHDLDSIIGDIKRMRTILKNTKSLNAVLEFLESNQVSVSELSYNSKSFSKGLTRPKTLQSSDRAACVMNNLKNGMNEKSIIRTDRYVYENNSVVGLKDITKPDRAVSVVQSIDNGMTEKTIIKQVRDHYSAIHPTQKPVRLLERLLALVIPEDKGKEDIVVFDPFGGSFSTMEAVYNMQMKGISCEIDKEYFEAGKKRIESLPPRQTSLFD